MREIKFRAWNKETGRMSKSYAHMGKNGQLYVAWEGHDSELVLMQYTGLKDKNGKEIYEGDVVQMHQFLFDGTEVEQEHTGVVSYNEEQAAFFFTYIRGAFYSEHTGYEDGTDSEGSPICFFYGLHDESFEILGNIYENPELLEEPYATTE